VPQSQFCSLGEALSHVPDGARIGISKFNPCGALLGLVRQGKRDLKLVAVPTAGIGADILASGGALASIEAGALVMASYGTTPNVVRGIDDGTIELIESSCPILELQLLAGMSGLGFTEIPGVFGTDVFNNRTDLKVVQDPFDKDYDVVLAPSLRPDVTIVHGFRADPEGNVVIYAFNEDRQLIKASRRVIVTVEEVRADATESLKAYEEVVPSAFIDTITVLPGGMRPFGCPGYYEEDPEAIKSWIAGARDPIAARAHLEMTLEKTFEKYANA